MARNSRQIEKLIDYWEPQVRRSFLDAVYQMREQAYLPQIIRMLEQGNVEGAIQAVGLDPTQLRNLDQTISSAFEASGNAAAAAVPVNYTADGFRTIFQFNVRNPTAENWLQESAAKMVQQITTDQQIMIRETLVDGLSKGLNPRTTALDLVGRINPSTGRREGGQIGLTSSQAEWVRNYREELGSDNPLQALDRNLRDRRFDGAVRRAAESGQRLSSSQIDDMVDSYENRALKFRADAIARTETIHSLHEAQQQAMAQAVESGAIDPGALGFIWRTAGDERVRDIHVVMDGQRVSYGEFFVDGDGNQLEYPGDPNAPLETTIFCRCWREPDVDFLASLGEVPSETPLLPDVVQEAEIAAAQVLPKINITPGLSAEAEARYRGMVEELPPDVLSKLAEKDISFAFSKHLTDTFPELKGVQPRGWPMGSTWDEAEGLYNPGGRRIALSEYRTRADGVVVAGDRERGVLFHEAGHGFDDALDRVSTTQEFRNAYITDTVKFTEADRRLYSYFVQPGSAGPSEAFAEVFAVAVMGEGATAGQRLVDIAAKFPETAKFIKGLLA